MIPISLAAYLAGQPGQVRKEPWQQELEDEIAGRAPRRPGTSPPAAGQQQPQGAGFGQQQPAAPPGPEEEERQRMLARLQMQQPQGAGFGQQPSRLGPVLDSQGRPDLNAQQRQFMQYAGINPDNYNQTTTWMDPEDRQAQWLKATGYAPDSPQASLYKFNPALFSQGQIDTKHPDFQMAMRLWGMGEEDKLKREGFASEEKRTERQAKSAEEVARITTGAKHDPQQRFQDWSDRYLMEKGRRPTKDEANEFWRGYNQPSGAGPVPPGGQTPPETPKERFSAAVPEQFAAALYDMLAASKKREGTAEPEISPQDLLASFASQQGLSEAAIAQQMPHLLPFLASQYGGMEKFAGHLDPSFLSKFAQTRVVENTVDRLRGKPVAYLPADEAWRRSWLGQNVFGARPNAKDRYAKMLRTFATSQRPFDQWLADYLSE